MNLSSPISPTPLENITGNMTEAGIGKGAVTGTSFPLRPCLHQSHPLIIPIDDCQNPPRAARNQTSQGEPGFFDSSGPILSMYLETAKEEDKEMAESWKADAEGILVFVRLYLLAPCFTPTDKSKTGLFSAAVASLISVSIQDLRQNPQDTSNFYLANMYQASITDPNRSNSSNSLPASPPPFSPPTYSVWVNSLWFLSLVISITCALLATLLQQWARKYLKVTETRSSLHKRARVRSFFAEGVKKGHLSMVVEALPTLIHLSVSLFFAGLAVFLWNVNLTIFKVVLSWISICTALYGFITLVSIFRHDSPYYSPLTPLVRPIVFVITFALWLLYYICFYMFVLFFCTAIGRLGSVRIFGNLNYLILQVVKTTRKTPKKVALEPSSEIDALALTWTFDSLDEDHELERFFSGLPGFHNSGVLKQPLHSLDDEQKLSLLEGVIRLWDRAFSSNLLSDQVKSERADICANAIELLDSTPYAYPNIVGRLAFEDEYGPVQSSKIVDFVKGWGDRKGEHTTLDQPILSVVVARIQQRDDSWFHLAPDHLGISETVLRSHAAQGDNLSLAILIHVTRQQFSHIQNSSWPSDTISNVLEAASNFNVQDTSSELQHEFCAIWNQVVRKAQNGNDWKIPEDILKPIRQVYIRLHLGTNSAPANFSASTPEGNNILFDPHAYPVCNVTGHVHDGSASVTFPHPVPHRDAMLSPAPLTSLDAPSFPVPASRHVDESLTTPPSLDNPHPTPQTVDNVDVSVTSGDPATAGVMQDIVTAGITKTLPTPKTSLSTSTSPLSSASWPPDVSLQHNAHLLAPSDPPNLPSSASDTNLDNIFHTGPSLSSHSLI
jgi:hypothetical protein